MNAQQRTALEAFVVENDDLEQLESLLAEFNIFEALGAVRQELRHSDFLAYLLDPAQGHGLGEAFLKRLLTRVLKGTTDPPLSPIEIDVADLRQAIVLREWRNIDILIQDAETRLVCAIENKVGSTEHSGQLTRYFDTVSAEFPGYARVFIYLTPEGDTPSNEAYIPFSYDQVAELVDTVRQARQSTLGPDVGTLMAHYTATLRRHIVSKSEIAQLCQRIYRRHKQALDLIFEHHPDLQWEMAEQLKQIVAGSAASHGLELDHCTKTAPRFAVTQWDREPGQLAGQGWTPSKRVLLFEFQNQPDRLRLVLYIGPGPQAVRQAIFDAVQRHKKTMPGGRSTLAAKWTTVYVKRFLTQGDYDDGDLEMLTAKAQRVWQQFLNQDLPAIESVIDQVSWPEL